MSLPEDCSNGSEPNTRGQSREHGHSHGFSGHAHGANETRIAIAAVLTGLFMVAEIVGGFISGSLALLADAGHMLTDFAALGLGFAAFRLARKPRDAKRTYGYARFEVLIAFVNGLTLFGIAAFLVYEAWHRLQQPGEILGGTMLAVAIAGLAVNVLVFFVLHGADRDNLNIRGAVLHVVGDILGSVAAIAAAVIILVTGWTPIDPLLSMFVALLILISAWRLVRDAGHVLLEGAPREIDASQIGPSLVRAIDGLLDVHHVHLWTLTPERKMATLHAEIGSASDGPEAVRTLKAHLRERFGIEHTTIEVERETCADTGETQAPNQTPYAKYDQTEKARRTADRT